MGCEEPSGKVQTTTPHLRGPPCVKPALAHHCHPSAPQTCSHSVSMDSGEGSEVGIAPTPAGGDTTTPTNGVHEPQSAPKPPINEAKLAKNKEKKRRKKKKKKAPAKPTVQEATKV